MKASPALRETSSLAPCLKGLAASLGFAEKKPGLYMLELGEDVVAYIDFRRSWKGWRYAFRDGKPLAEEELAGIEPLRRFKELRDGIIALAGGTANSAAPVRIDELLENFRSLQVLRGKLLDDDDYLYLDARENPTAKSRASYKLIKKKGWRKLAYALGLNLLILGKERLTCCDEKGEYYIWTYRVLVVDPRSGRFVEAEGACSSRDAVVSMGREVSDADVMHRAQSAAMSRGISDLLAVEPLEEVDVRTRRGKN
jgi:hypothetical protein